jgi:hypothetical protein
MGFKELQWLFVRPRDSGYAAKLERGFSWQKEVSADTLRILPTLLTTTFCVLSTIEMKGK